MTIHTVHSTHHEPMTRVSLGLALFAAILVLAVAALFAIAYAIGGEDATSDNWVGLITMLGLYGGLLSSLGAFVMAFVAWRVEEFSRTLWLPLAVFPALVAFIVLGEAYWWE
jgi:hypothetical protein